MRLRSKFADRAAACCTERGIDGVEAMEEAAYFANEAGRLEAHEGVEETVGFACAICPMLGL